MNRIAMAQAALDRTPDATYLEIGISHGYCFRRIRAKRKWGVDPAMDISKRRRLRCAALTAFGLSEERLFDVPSDRFFVEQGPRLLRHGVDVCLVDGLHTYEQSLRDVLNVLPFLNDGGVILIDDCNPPDPLAATTYEWLPFALEKHPDWDARWSGDVWKTIVHLRSLRDDVDVFVADCDTGVGVVTKRASRTRLPYTAPEIRAMDYDTLVARRAELLHLKPLAEFDALLGAPETRAGA